jgi:methionyl aminopeptidase
MMKKIIEYIEEIKIGDSILKIAEDIEQIILSNGYKPAFPVNIGINRVAAHYTPRYNDDYRISNDLVKIDFGYRSNGLIWDNAITIDFTGKYQKMIDVAIEAIEEASKIIKVGTKISEISEVIYNTVNSSGFNVIKDLTGHMIYEYDLHGRSIPCVPNNDNYELKKGDRLALEVFVTDGPGRIYDGKNVEIFQFIGRANNRFYSFLENEYKGLPFARRWLYKQFSKVLVDQYLNSNFVAKYPELIEYSGYVAQYEKTIIV